MIDTLTISKQLQEGGVSRNEADAIAIQMAKFAESELASKQNLKETELVLRNELKETELKLQKEIEEVRKEIRELEIRLNDKINAQLKWIAGFLVGQTALLFTLIKLFG